MKIRFNAQYLLIFMSNIQPVMKVDNEKHGVCHGILHVIRQSIFPVRCCLAEVWLMGSMGVLALGDHVASRRACESRHRRRI